MPKGYQLGASENGWINKKLFYQYGKTLIQYMWEWGLLEDNKKHLLPMDSYNAHTFNYQFMKSMIENNIVVLVLPSHTTHLIQPLDDAPFVGFKNEWYKNVCSFFAIPHCGKKISKAEFFSLFVPAWIKSVTVQSIQAGFQNTGLWPVNRVAITDDKNGSSNFLQNWL